MQAKDKLPIPIAHTALTLAMSIVFLNELGSPARASITYYTTTPYKQSRRHASSVGRLVLFLPLREFRQQARPSRPSSSRHLKKAQRNWEGWRGQLLFELWRTLLRYSPMAIDRNKLKVAPVADFANVPELLVSCHCLGQYSCALNNF